MEQVEQIVKGNGRKRVKDAMVEVEGKQKEAKVHFTPIKVERIKVKIQGDTPYLSHRFPEKARKQIKDKGEGLHTVRELKNPEEEYRASIYHIDGDVNRCGIPCSAFKNAMIDCLTKGSSISKTMMTQAVHVVGELAEITGKHTMHSCIARVGRYGAKQPDMRYRAEFKNWSVMLEIRYDARKITPEVILNVLNDAGFGVGVGDWRPQKKGTFGTFHVEC